jgi:hypothetical protein
MQKRVVLSAVMFVLALSLSGHVAAQQDMSEGFKLRSTLSGAQEVTPPMGGTLTGGEIVLEFDAGFSQVMVTLTLEGDATNAGRAHLHCARPGVDGPIFLGLVDPGICDPAQLSAGMLSCTLTNENFDVAADCMGTVDRPVNNIAALFFAARDGLVYANVHTVENPSGELRGQLLEEGDASGTTPPPPAQ